MTKENPFNITFGKEPSSVISRSGELDEIYNSFNMENPNSPVYILTGIRGSGKTVAMTSVSEYYKKQEKWICVELNPESDMLDQLASKIYDEGKIKKLFIKTEFSFSFHGLGISVSGTEPVANVSSFLKREFTYLKNKKISVLITIDEAVSNTYMKIFAHEFQSFLRENFRVCLLMTGLYQNISQLEKQKSLTFLYRAPKLYLGELNVRAIANSYQNIFNITEAESIKLTKLTCGYAFAYQLLGNLLYENQKTAADEQILTSFDNFLYARAYSIIYSELTEKEKELLTASLSSPLNKDMLSVTEMSKSMFSQYKKNLILKGILKTDKSSFVFALPRFREFLIFMYEYDEDNDF